ncbi:MAG: NifU protein [Candidatus Methanoperedens nitroreducens]|uniref:NifU protein n=1 Tax=Candidatus Methanoperedens nitratireducens TaxID=1392998 RepID=A0A0P8A7P6_9EURY|nr:Fe-S cluster assembly scaffold protein NifU [Candidatus Methanoperedens sp. BLZ2]KAB2943063.1 MAG: Fe-S cluster assembly scaffold protein NifU [Candidatus Methanoperedens sp.]KPQ44147.1 MAG: NifU protein [Candidatus Methanoperedens sp. BLZ1]MBZ0176883.1 Fe-S cluster assembly scaffold protein NifU [Candidatus Methanoperedens nitroreducens]MCX9076557.1 Fe-S cluster assembly scaffold protein NifU [Candidatus Methanoperedens sp.]
MEEQFEYSEKVMDHFRNPRNVGQIKDADGTGRVGNPVCGDLMEIQIKVENNILKDVKFKTFGCGSAIATSSMITEMAIGKTLEEALKITRGEVAAELGGLPLIKMHCSNLAADALHAAIKDYMSKKEEKAKLEAEKYDFDVIVVGGGPGGLTTGILCAYRGLKTAIFEASSWGGILSWLCPDKMIENFPGLCEKSTCSDLVNSWMNEAKKLKVEMKKERVNEITPDRKVIAESGEYRGKILVLATGSSPATGGIKGEDKFSKDEKGVYYYVRNPQNFQGKRVVIVGGGNSAADAALSLADTADLITIACRSDELKVAPNKIERLKAIDKVKVLYNTEVVEISGTDKVEKVIMKDLKEDELIQQVVDSVVLAVGLIPNTEIFKKLGLEMDDRGYLKTDKTQKTNIDGIYAVGDIASDLALVVVAVANGATVAHNAYVELRKPYWK